MVSSGMLLCVALVRSDVSEEPGASFIRVTRIGELGTTLSVTSNRRTLRRNTTRRNIPEDTILHSHRRGNLKSYIKRIVVTRICCHRQGPLHFGYPGLPTAVNPILNLVTFCGRCNGLRRHSLHDDDAQWCRRLDARLFCITCSTVQDQLLLRFLVV
jgi:hypothetical protein